MLLLPSVFRKTPSISISIHPAELSFVETCCFYQLHTKQTYEHPRDVQSTIAAWLMQHSSIQECITGHRRISGVGGLCISMDLRELGRSKCSPMEKWFGYRCSRKPKTGFDSDSRIEHFCLHKLRMKIYALYNWFKRFNHSPSVGLTSRQWVVIFLKKKGSRLCFRSVYVTTQQTD